MQTFVCMCVHTLVCVCSCFTCVAPITQVPLVEVLKESQRPSHVCVCVCVKTKYRVAAAPGEVE